MNACVVAFASMFAAGCTATGIGLFASVGGVYSGSVRNEGSTCPGIILGQGLGTSLTVTIEQTGANVTIHLDRLTSPPLLAVFGTNSFVGTVSENHIDATLTGMVRATSGGCIFTLNGELAANLNGGILTGDIIYTPQTNGHADCMSRQVASCIAKQTFGFTRNQRL